MTDHDKEIMFLEHRSVALSVARRFSSKYNRPLEETLDHAEFALVIFIYTSFKHSPSLSSLKSWLWKKVFWHLQEVYTKGRHPHCPNIREHWANGRPDRREIACSDQIEKWEQGNALHCPTSLHTKPSWLQNLIDEVGEEGATLLHIIADAPHDLIAEISSERGRTQNKRRANLMAYLVDVLNWPMSRVTRAFTEIETCLSR